MIERTSLPYILQKLVATDAVKHLPAEAGELVEELVRPFRHAEELLLLEKGFAVPFGEVDLCKVAGKVAQVIAREVEVFA